MARSWRVAALIIVTAAAFGCDTTQPLRQGSRLLRMSLDATAEISLWADVYDRYEDVNRDFIAQPSEFRGTTCTGLVERPTETAPVPIRYFADVTLVRAGTAERVRLTSASAATSALSVTPEDTRTIVGQTPPKAPVPPNCGAFPAPQCRKLFLNPRRVPLGSLALLNVNDIDENCGPNQQLLPPNIGGINPPVQLEVVAGDVLIVTAGKTTAASIFDSEPVFTGAITLDGVSVIPEGIVATDEVGGSIAFQFRIR